MHMDICHENKVVEIWLTNQEQRDPAILQSLKPIYHQYQAQKYQVAVFLSGQNPLYDQTRDLLLYNRRRLAEQEVQARKEFPSPMAT